MSKNPDLEKRVDKNFAASHISFWGKTDQFSSPHGECKINQYAPVSDILSLLLDELGYDVENVLAHTVLVKKDEEK